MSVFEKVKSALDGASLPGSVRVKAGDDFSVAVDSAGAFLTDNDDCDCTLSLSEDVLEGIVGGTTDPMGAYFSGGLKIEGDMGVAMALAGLLKG